MLNGQKIWISTAHLADWGLFLLRTDPEAIERGAKHEGITAFIINMHTPGIECRPIRDIAGDELFNEVWFTDARVPADCRLGEEGQGWQVAMGTLGHERVGTAGLAITMAADLRSMISAAKATNPDALHDPEIRERIARAFTDIEYTKLLNSRALTKIIKGEKNWPEVPLAKLQWSYLAQTLAELAVDLLGPAGLLAKGGPDASTAAPGHVCTRSALRRSAPVPPGCRRTSSPTAPCSPQVGRRRRAVKLGISRRLPSRLPRATWEDGGHREEIARVAVEPIGSASTTSRAASTSRRPRWSGARRATCWDPLATFGFIAARTTTIRLATHVLVLGYHHPLAIAKRYGTLDRVSGGLLILGVGVGSLRGVRPARRRVRGPRRRGGRAIRALRASLSQIEPVCQGEHCDHDGFVVDPCRQYSRGADLDRRTHCARCAGRSSSPTAGAPFGLARADLAEMVARAREGTLGERSRAADAPPFELVLQNEHPFDPGGEPDRARDAAARLAEAGATTLNVRVVHHSLEHYLEQLAAIRELIG